MSILKRVVLMASVAGLTSLAAACGPSVVAGHFRTNSEAPTTRPLPDVVDGVPLLALAKKALGAAEAYGVPAPADVRAVRSTEAAVARSMPTLGGTGHPGSFYFVTLRGHFTCGSCGTSTAGLDPTTTVRLSGVPISTMVLEVQIGGATNGVAVGVGDPDLSDLGRIYDLDPYVASLGGMPVPIGPLPG